MKWLDVILQITEENAVERENLSLELLGHLLEDS